ncbi:hypothetical protein [Acetobacterium woodii]|uniref:Uncharacterized protein n=1 Tax=Acetobacterium woodii (strain ATCC 29683 / DSM 1030 / JCM 2381 / KCTC 1655 / WB1) TaxID=931626 RepID=H6LIW6_ACEWD|nr:hypothetical protein [Acetobacterium woodii]AFA49855.1 hypothetical protein Awo_c31270 [Acetobacterium woodii DSM 1030]
MQGFEAISLLVAFIALIISLATLQQNRNIVEESNRAYIVLYIDRERPDDYKSIVLKNFGKTSGILLSVEFDPPLPVDKSKIHRNNRPLLTDFKNIFFAPGQSFKTHFDLKNDDAQIFNVIVIYETLGRTIKESYSIDLTFRKSLYRLKTDAETELDALKTISQSILEVSDKLS